MQQKLLAQIATALEYRSEISLLELIEIYPIDCGMEEVVEYLEIAHQPPHMIDDEVKESILVSRGCAYGRLSPTPTRLQTSHKALK